MGDPVLDLTHQLLQRYLSSEDLLSSENLSALCLQIMLVSPTPAYTTADQLFTEDYIFLVPLQAGAVMQRSLPTLLLRD